MSHIVWQTLLSMIDEIDYGLVIVDADAGVRCINHAARAAMAAGHPLAVDGDRLVASDGVDARRLRDALVCATERQWRRLIALGRGASATTVAIVPIRDADGTPLVMAMLAKPRVCERLSVEGFALAHQLTPSETRVLNALCQGAAPAAIAAESRVAISTVRTQISSVRSKTGTASIRDLLRSVSILPPLRGVLRQV